MLHAHPTAKLWNEAEEALLRVQGRDPLQAALVKMVGLLHILGEGTHVTPSREVLRTLLIAWARYEDEQPVGIRQENARNARNDWGRVARDFLSSDE